MNTRPQPARGTARRAWLRAALWGGLGSALVPGAGVMATQAVARPLQVTLLPYLSTRVMLAVFDPLRQHLAEHIGRPVDFFTATSFRALAESAQRGDSPFSLLPVPLARIALADWGHRLVVRPTLDSAVQVLVPRALGLADVQALRGRQVATIDPLSTPSLMLQRWLVAERLAGEVTVLHLASANAAAMALGRGDVAAVVLPQGPVVEVPGLAPGELVVLTTLGSMLMPCFVAHPSAPAADLLALQRGLIASNERPVQTTWGRFVEGSPRDLAPYEPYAALARQRLAQPAR
ncbi:MAG: PhnD/SsuA/transferrin family substrate-binding protein [Burkholderiales bacterium]|nr:PhnD/SsuA/transferrin family substrate-binding protein [Burkholderiales bacterium]